MNGLFYFIRRHLSLLQLCWSDTRCHLLSFSVLHIMVCVVVQSLSCVQLFATPWTAALQTLLSFTISLSLLTFNHLICCPLLCLPSIFPSIRVFSNESALRIRWPKYWSYSFSISPSNERPGLISFRMDWLDLLAVQGTLKSLLQHHSSKASINSLALSLYGPTLISVHDDWKSHSFNYVDLCWQSDVSAF